MAYFPLKDISVMANPWQHGGAKLEGPHFMDSQLPLINVPRLIAVLIAAISFIWSYPLDAKQSHVPPEPIKNVVITPAITGVASWYSENDPGVLKTTANMEIFDDSQLTCAMWEIPFGTKIKVTNLKNNKSVIVRVNDRGPAKRLVKEGRVIDLTKEAFAQLSALKDGLIPIELIILSEK